MMLTLIVTGAILYLPALALRVGHRGLIENIHVITGLSLLGPLVLGVVGPWRKRLIKDLRRFDRWGASDFDWFKSQRPPLGSSPGQVQRRPEDRGCLPRRGDGRCARDGRHHALRTVVVDHLGDGSDTRARRSLLCHRGGGDRGHLVRAVAAGPARLDGQRADITPLGESARGGLAVRGRGVRGRGVRGRRCPRSRCHDPAAPAFAIRCSSATTPGKPTSPSGSAW